MNKAIIMSIQPEGLAKILNGEKTIEIRKSMPKCELPIDVYLYCSKAAPNVGVYQGTISKKKEYGLWHLPFGDYVEKYGDKNGREIDINGKVVAKFTLNKVEKIIPRIKDLWKEDTLDNDYKTSTLNANQLIKKAYMNWDELDDYLKCEKGYAWHIDNLVIFDKPKELSEFYKDGGHLIGNGYTDYLPPERITKAPQSWQYVYVKGEQK